MIDLLIFQGDKLPPQLPPELFEDKVPKPLSSLPNFTSASPKVSPRALVIHAFHLINI